MKASIWKQFIVSAVIPYLLLNGVLLCVILNFLYTGAPLHFIVIMILAYCVIALIFFAALIVYFTIKVFSPLRKLTKTLDEIAGGGVTEVPITREYDEIGVLSRALYHVVEQFRVSNAIEEQSRTLLDIYTRINQALYEKDDLRDVFTRAMVLVSDYFKVSRVYMVLVERGKPFLVSTYTLGVDEEPKSYRQEFPWHKEVISLLKDRQFVSLNSYVLRSLKLNCINSDTVNLCIIPLNGETEMRGYIVMESNNDNSALVNNDSALQFMSSSVSYILANKEAARRASAEAGNRRIVSEAPASGGEEADVLAQARHIEGLDVDNGLERINGNREQYRDLLRITGRVLKSDAARMRGSYRDKLPDFAIAVHGSKSALYSIGAKGLGDRAFELEREAKAGNAAFCEAKYPPFEDDLLDLASTVNALFPEADSSDKKAGDKGDLEKILRESLDLLKSYDLVRAEKLLSPMTEYNWGDVEGEVRVILDKLDNIEYEEAAAEIEKLLETLAAGKT
jgi:HPt (histidine-containing phosphotransfer) domain-containing protein